MEETAVPDKTTSKPKVTDNFLSCQSKVSASAVVRDGEQSGQCLRMMVEF